MAEELVPVKPEETAIAQQTELPDWLGLQKHASLSTFDTKTQDGLRLLSKMGVGCDRELSAAIGEELEVVSWYMTPYDKLDNLSGEVTPLVFIGLVDANGVTYSTSSIGVRKSLLMLAREFGFKPWIPPCRVKVRSVKLSVGNMFALEFLSRAEQTGKKSK